MKTRYYWTFINFGVGGWYAEVTKNAHEAIVDALPKLGPLAEDENDKMLALIPVAERVEIVQH